MKDLTCVDIGTFCLISKKYEKEIIDEGGTIIEDIDYFLNGCSESVSEQLKIMDSCQKILWEYGHDVNKKEEILKLKEYFEEGINTLNSVLRAFDIAVSDKKDNEDNPIHKEE